VKLVIGTRKWSSWSLRPWLVARRARLAVEEVLVPLRQGDLTEAAIRAAGSPSGLAPALIDGDLVVWDSLAICEHLAEIAPAAALWPRDRAARATARAACAEMHAGFHSLRGECPMDLLRAPAETTLSEATHKDIRRLVSLFAGLRTAYGAGGPYLLGAWSIADAFFTPVATRFRTYGVRLSTFEGGEAAADYVLSLLEDADFRGWEAAARREG
jgi:glutathione S-transferase